MTLNEHSNVLITGFPGFIGKFLTRELVKTHPHLKLWLLTHPTMHEQAQKTFQELKLNPQTHHIVFGDITKPQLGLEGDTLENIQKNTHIVFHLAAIYDLTVPEKKAHHVNVFGTQNMLDFFSHSPSLIRFNYISTCYVSGSVKGIITPDKLQQNQSFHNFYESTKHAAEVLVKNKINDLPITIFRPAIVVGHSQTGETEKFDGPYVVMKFLHRIKFLLRLVPNLGYDYCEVNTVPVDYLVKVLVYLGFNEKAKAKTYQICDETPPTTEEFFEEIVTIIGHVKPYHCRFLKYIILKLLRLSLVSKITGITREHLDYFLHEGRYRSPNLKKDLEGSHMELGSYKKFYPTLYQYMKDHI
ncbi:MAG: SDR family oxidoreductase [Deltaproteobacteria bacterium]|nr:SDR family oxidoreductase [Deltaproteobacteria bacterium]